MSRRSGSEGGGADEPALPTPIVSILLAGVITFAEDYGVPFDREEAAQRKVLAGRKPIS